MRFLFVFMFDSRVEIEETYMVRIICALIYINTVQPEKFSRMVADN